MPTWLFLRDEFYGMPDLESRGLKVANDRHGPAADPDTQSRIATRRIPRSRTTIRRPPVPRPERLARRRNARLPIRKHLERRFSDRSASGLRKCLAGGRRFRSRIQTRSIGRRIRFNAILQAGAPAPSTSPQPKNPSPLLARNKRIRTTSRSALSRDRPIRKLLHRVSAPSPAPRENTTSTPAKQKIAVAPNKFRFKLNLCSTLRPVEPAKAKSPPSTTTKPSPPAIHTPNLPPGINTAPGDFSRSGDKQA